MTGLARLTLILGGARSGKSAEAERLVSEAGRPAVYIATAEALDGEMRARIAQHRARRDKGWTTVEVPRELAQAIERHAGKGAPVLVDCLTLWLSNVMHAGNAEAEVARLVKVLAATPGPVVAVSNELGLGVVPENALARRFRDAHGCMNQEVAAVASRVTFMAAGIALSLKG